MQEGGEAAPHLAVALGAGEQLGVGGQVAEGDGAARHRHPRQREVDQRHGQAARLGFCVDPPAASTARALAMPSAVGVTATTSGPSQIGRGNRTAWTLWTL